MLSMVRMCLLCFAPLTLPPLLEANNWSPTLIFVCCFAQSPPRLNLLFACVILLYHLSYGFRLGCVYLPRLAYT